MLLYGASGHCKVIIDCLKSKNEAITGIIDDDINKSSFCGLEVYHKYEDVKVSDKLIISIGDNRIRKKVSEKVNHEFGIIAHLNSTIAENVLLGGGTVIFHNSVIQADTILGKHVIVNTTASIDHDCRIDDYCHISPNATLCGNVKCGEGTQIGAGAVVIQNRTIGKWCTIGAGAVIIKDIPDYATVVGNPGRILKIGKNER